MPDSFRFSLDALQVFESAARLGSFKAAATELSVTPTAVSHRIRALEEALDCALFHRQVRAWTRVWPIWPSAMARSRWPGWRRRPCSGSVSPPWLHRCCAGSSDLIRGPGR